jgi:prevent-host-death family protein
MERIGIRELRDNLTATIRRVRAGATIEVTHHHQPVARLTPIAEDRIASLLRSGELTPGVPLDRPLRKFRPTTGVTASEALAEDRAER